LITGSYEEIVSRLQALGVEVSEREVTNGIHLFEENSLG